MIPSSWKRRLFENSSKVVDGKVRKYYQATTEGKQVLEQSKKRIRELVTEVIEEKEPDWPAVKIIGEAGIYDKQFLSNGSND